MSYYADDDVIPGLLTCGPTNKCVHRDVCRTLDQVCDPATTVEPTTGREWRDEHHCLVCHPALPAVAA